jgi:predicted porin
MKKSLIALAVMAAAGAASAQSSVTLFGIVDATLAWGRGDVDRFRVTNSGYNSSRLGFRGTEDLGGGMSASFWLEAGVNNDDGTGAATNVNNQASGGALAGMNGSQGLTFNRRSTVSLAGGWGELRIGRDYTPQFWNLTVFDPFGTNGAGTTQTLNSIITGVTAVRASNTIGYFLPGNLGGFYGQIQHYRGENASGAATSSDGNGNGLRLGYAAGPVNVALAVSKTKYAAGDVKQNNIGAQWDFGVAKLKRITAVTSTARWMARAGCWVVWCRSAPAKSAWPTRAIAPTWPATRPARSWPWATCTTCPRVRLSMPGTLA